MLTTLTVKESSVQQSGEIFLEIKVVFQHEVIIINPVYVRIVVNDASMTI